MIPVIYVVLLFIMLYTLYRAGLAIRESGKVFSPAGLTAIIVYTLNEGLRFGRGIDYNLYGMSYEELERTGESDWDVSFQFIARMLVAFDIPWQGYVILLSLVFILATIFLLRAYKDVLPYALPLFALFSLAETENMVRWYLGFSFILIGLYYLIDEDKRSYLKFWGFSGIACTFHLALLPLPLAFCFLYLKKTPLLSPVWVLILYFVIGFAFHTEFMLQFVELVNVLSMTLGESSERLANYGNKAEYWLTGGTGTDSLTSFPDKQEILFLCCIVWLGYRIVKETDRKYVFAYNMFVIGLLTYPVARQIELVWRYNQPFMFFRAILLASILEYVFKEVKVKISQLAWILSLLIILNMGRKMIMNPFYGNQEKYLYVWDQQSRTYQSMYDIWLFDMENSNVKKTSVE